MEIPKAIVLAGDRHLPEHWPGLGLLAPQLVSVANKPVLIHHLEALVSAGVREAVLLTGERTGPQIRAVVGDGSALGLAVSHIADDRASNPLASPAVAEFAGGSDLLVGDGDVLLEPVLAALGTSPWEDRFDALVLRPADRPGAARSSTSAPAIGYALRAGVQARLRGLPGGGAGTHLVEALAAVRRAGARVEEREVEACMPCRGAMDTLLEANRLMLEAMTPQHQGERVFSSQLHGRVDLHPSAEIRDSLIRGPVAIGPRARVENAYIGPYTSIAADVEIDAVEVEHSILLDRARVKFLGERLDGCVIGPDARVIRDFGVPRAVRLRLGQGAEIVLP